MQSATSEQANSSRCVLEGAIDDEMKASWEVVHLVDDSLDQSDTSKSTLQRKPNLQAFFDHCCQIRHYSFCIKKCGSSECEICKPVRKDGECFRSIHFLPDPVMGSDDHYISFSDVYGMNTSENEHPSLVQRRKIKTLTYSPTEQHACNAGVLLQCDECDK